MYVCVFIYIYTHAKIFFAYSIDVIFFFMYYIDLNMYKHAYINEWKIMRLYTRFPWI